MIKRLFWMFLLIFFFSSTFLATKSYASNSINAGAEFNDLDGDGKFLGEAYRENYSLDIEKTDVFEAGDYMLNQIANALFSVIRILGLAVSVFFYYAMTFDVAQVFATEINNIQSALKLSIFDGFFTLAFAASAWGLMKRITKRDLSGLVVEVGKILCIFLLSSFVVTHSATALSAATSITKDISVSALMNINQQGNVTIESYAASASGMIWKSLVHAPWVSLEFESGTADDATIESFLKTSPGSDDRKQLVVDFRNDYPNAMSKTKGVGRIGFLIVYLIPFLVKSGIFMFTAVLQLAFQVMAVFYILLAPVILLLSLIPIFGGIELVSSWLKKVMETQIMIIIITFILGIIISLDTFLYSKSGEYGWFIVIFMETLVALVVVINHKSILIGLSKMTKSVRQPGALNAQLKRSGDVFGALGSGKGIRNLSPVKRYIDKINGFTGGSGYKNTSYSSYNNYKQSEQYAASTSEKSASQTTTSQRSSTPGYKSTTKNTSSASQQKTPEYSRPQSSQRVVRSDSVIETRQETPNRPSIHPKSTNTVTTSEQNKQSSFTQAPSGAKYSGNSAVEDNKANNKPLSSTKPTISHSERNNVHQESPKSPSDRPLSYAPKKEGLTTEKTETPKKKRNRYTVPQNKKNNNKNNVVKSMKKSDKPTYI